MTLIVPNNAEFLRDPAWNPTIVVGAGERPQVVFDRDYAGGLATITAKTTGLFGWTFKIAGLAFFGGVADGPAEAWIALRDALAGAGIAQEA